VAGSGLIVPSTSGGVALASSQSSISVLLTSNGTGRIFVGGASGSINPAPVGSGASDQARVGFPIGPSSGQFFQPTRINISNPALLSVSAEASGQILFYGIETP
jgi:hypothetical protein